MTIKLLKPLGGNADGSVLSTTPLAEAHLVDAGLAMHVNKRKKSVKKKKSEPESDGTQVDAVVDSGEGRVG